MKIVNKDYPLNLFKKLYKAFEKDCEKNGISYANAVTLSTSFNNQPSSRVVLVKYIKEDGLYFFTNLNSKKSKELKDNNNASLLFYWAKYKRQIRIEGKVELLDNEISDSYFKTRDYLSKIGAWSSRQSETFSKREDFENRTSEFAKKFPQDVPKPEHWGGFKFVPSYWEFWKEKPNRLHYRVEYKYNDNGDFEENFLFP